MNKVQGLAVYCFRQTLVIAIAVRLDKGVRLMSGRHWPKSGRLGGFERCFCRVPVNIKYLHKCLQEVHFQWVPHWHQIRPLFAPMLYPLSHHPEPGTENVLTIQLVAWFSTFKFLSSQNPGNKVVFVSYNMLSK